MSKTISEINKSLGDCISIQRCCLTGPGSDYMYGMLNGMLLAESIINDTTPTFATPLKRKKNRRNKIRRRK